MSISDLIVVMKDGVVHQIGKPQEVYDDPVNQFVATFLGTPPINIFHGRIEDGQLFIGEESVLSVKNVPNQEVVTAIRPEGFILDENGPLSCKLSRVEVMGRDISVVSTHDLCDNAAIRAIIDAENEVDTDSDTVRFSVKPNKLYLFAHDTGERIRFEV